MRFQAKHVLTKIVAKRVCLGEVRFYIIMVGLYVSFLYVYTETRVYLKEMNTFYHTNGAVCFWIC